MSMFTLLVYDVPSTFLMASAIVVSPTVIIPKTESADLGRNILGTDSSALGTTQIGTTGKSYVSKW